MKRDLDFEATKDFRFDELRNNPKELAITAMEWFDSAMLEDLIGAVLNRDDTDEVLDRYASLIVDREYAGKDLGDFS